MTVFFTRALKGKYRKSEKKAIIFCYREENVRQKREGNFFVLSHFEVSQKQGNGWLVDCVIYIFFYFFLGGGGVSKNATKIYHLVLLGDI